VEADADDDLVEGEGGVGRVGLEGELVVVFAAKEDFAVIDACGLLAGEGAALGGVAAVEGEFEFIVADDTYADVWCFILSFVRS